MSFCNFNTADLKTLLVLLLVYSYVEPMSMPELTRLVLRQVSYLQREQKRRGSHLGKHVGLLIQYLETNLKCKLSIKPFWLYDH